ncbi:MAG: hypothetical protein RLZZ126_1382 [Pseudomonadota bacterium]
MKHLTLLASALLAAGLAHAQTIERVKLTDNDLNCQAIYAEITQMDTVITRGNQMVAAGQPAAPAPAAAQDGQSPVAGQVMGAVAQQALGNVAARGGGGLFGGGGGLGGLFGGGGGGGAGGLFGNIAAAAVQNQAQQAPVQQAAPAQPSGQTAQAAALVQQAQARKEHLTGLFLGKSCKMADIQR